MPKREALWNPLQNQSKHWAVLRAWELKTHSTRIFHKYNYFYFKLKLKNFLPLPQKKFLSRTIKLGCILWGENMPTFANFSDHQNIWTKQQLTPKTCGLPSYCEITFPHASFTQNESFKLAIISRMWIKSGQNFCVWLNREWLELFF